MTVHPDWLVRGQFMLLGPDDAITPEWVSRLLEHVGTPAEWAAVGLPIMATPQGRLAPLVLDIVLRDDGPIAVRGAELEAARQSGEDVERRMWDFILVSEDEASEAPRCVRAGVRAPL